MPRKSDSWEEVEFVRRMDGMRVEDREDEDKTCGEQEDI